jgi:DNA oxidative demethylase
LSGIASRQAMTRGSSMDLFGDLARERSAVPIDAGAVLLVAHAQQRGPALLDAALAVLLAAPTRHMPTRSGGRISVAMSNCGSVGWVSDRDGYRYDAIDPDSGRPWPPMPAVFLALAREAAQLAGYPYFAPDVCLINRYQPGDRLGLHQDMDEGELESPIVSVSLGLGAQFLWGGKLRREPTRRIPLAHGDVMVWGGPTRLNFHGVHSIADGYHPLTGPFRYNLTFRRCGTRAA